jgi:predicted transcriptional regulator
MPHKDRETRLTYLRAWKARHRPAPTPKPQSDASLPPRGAVSFSSDGTQVQCHVCGRWLGALNAHLRTHGLDAAAYKELYELARTASLWPPALKAKQREAALARGLGEIGRAALPAASRPRGQQARLGVRIAASAARTGIYMRGGGRTFAR